MVSFRFILVYHLELATFQFLATLSCAHYKNTITSLLAIDHVFLTMKTKLPFHIYRYNSSTSLAFRRFGEEVLTVLSSLTLLHFPTAQFKYPPSQFSTKISFCCIEEEERCNLQESRALHSDGHDCYFQMRGERCPVGIINIFAIKTEVAGQTSTRTPVLHRWHFCGHQCKLLIPYWTYNIY